MPKFETLFSKYDRLVLFDTETTGLLFSRDEIIEFAAAVLEKVDGTPRVVQEYDQLVALSPGGFVPPKIQELTGISTQDLRERGLPKTRVCRDIAEMIQGNTLLLAYNAHFDLSFLFYMLLRDGDPAVLKGKDKLDLLTVYRPKIPVVWNSGGYDRVDTLKTLEGKIDIYLPDLKYLDPDTAQRYSAARDYPENAQAAILEMYRQTGPCVFDEHGLLRRGLIIRHLILPGQVNGAKAVMDYVAGTFPPHTVLFSLMSQYTPWGDLCQTPELDRRLRRGEMTAAADYMRNLGLDGFCQERTSAKEEYTPPFDLTGV